MQAYRDAIFRVVRPGDVVIDLGAGAGILGMHACVAGAARVYAIECTDIVDLIPGIAAANGFGDRVIVRKGLSFDVDLPERADVIVASMLDSFGINNNLLEIVADARRRLLKPGGIIIPSAVRMSYCPVELPEWYESKIDCWNPLRSGFDFQDCRPFAVNQTTGIVVKKDAMLAEPASLDEISLSDVNSSDVSSKASFTICRSGIFHGLSGWFDATMAEDIRGGNSPLDPQRFDWATSVFPVDRPVPVQAGDRIAASIRTVTSYGAMTWVWTARVYSAEGDVRADFRHSTFQGQIFAKESLRRTSSEMVPRLSVRGQAELAVLENCNGRCSSAEIAELIRSRFPQYFESLDAAQAFAAAILNRPNLIEAN
jgi:protein arginine N-methyltransferase 1